LVAQRRGEHFLQSFPRLSESEQDGRLHHNRFGQYRRRCRVCRNVQSRRRRLLRSRRARGGTDADTDSNGYTKRDSDSYAGRDSDSYADRDSDSYADCNANSNTRRHTDTYSCRDTYANTRRHTDTYSCRDAHARAYSYADPSIHPNTNPHADSGGAGR
jgi:hypothetical protein